MEDRSIPKEFGKLVKERYADCLLPTVMEYTGNMYTASLYASLLSLIHTRGDRLAGKRVMMFSYGSGLAATLFSIKVGSTSGDLGKENN